MVDYKSKLKIKKIPGLRIYVTVFLVTATAWGAAIFLYSGHAREEEKRLVEEYMARNSEEAQAVEVEKTMLDANFDAETHRQMAEYLFDRKQYGQAVRHFERVIRMDDVIFIESNLDFCMKLADAYIQSRRTDDAISYLRKITAFFPRETGALRRLGEAYFHLGDGEKAAEYFREALKLNPSDGESIVFLARIYFKSDRTRKDIPELFEKAVQLNPQSVQAQYNYGVYLNEIGEYEYAIGHFKKALAAQPFHSPSIARLGMIYYYQGKTAPAKEMYELALSVNPTDYNTMYNLGELYLTSLNRPVEAFEWFRKVLEFKKDHFFAQKKLGIIALNNRNYKEACLWLEGAYATRRREKEYQREAAAFDKEIVDVLIMNATALEELGRKADAIAKLEMALEENPLDRIARHKLTLLQQEG